MAEKFVSMPPHIDPSSLLNSIYKSAIDVAIITLDKRGIITTWNAGAENITGFKAEEMIGDHLDRIFTPEDLAAHMPQKEIITALTTGRAADYRWHLRKNGTKFWADGIMTPIFNELDEHVGFVKIVRDFTEKKIAETDMHRLINFDALTGLANRFSFDLRLKELTAMSRRSGRLLIMQCIDLDRFKEVNDTLGHEAGDILLKHVAQRMRQTVRDTDVVARLGGDEFVVLQPGMASPEAGGELASKLIEIICRPYYIDGHQVMIMCSIGIAVCPSDADEPAELMKRADLALYRAKKDRRGGYHYFTKGLDEAIHRRNQYLTKLREAEHHKQFRLEYQPQISCETGEPVAMEALLRFNHPALGNLPVEEVIDLAVESGLMPNISAWVLRQACAQARKWHDMGYDSLKVSVNMCSRELMDAKTPRLMEDILAETGVDPVDLEIELTERQALEAGEAGSSTLDEIHSCGISIALDDFGKGYSALSLLRSLPINRIKLDGIFLRDVPEDADSCAVVRSTIALAHALHIEVVAEGVETQQQSDFLRGAGCFAMQGFLFTASLPPEESSKWLKNNRQAMRYPATGSSKRLSH